MRTYDFTNSLTGNPVRVHGSNEAGYFFSIWDFMNEEQKKNGTSPFTSFYNPFSKEWDNEFSPYADIAKDESGNLYCIYRLRDTTYACPIKK